MCAAIEEVAERTGPGGRVKIDAGGWRAGLGRAAIGLTERKYAITPSRSVTSTCHTSRYSSGVNGASAAGTGKLTRLLVDRFAHVVAVEPSDAMR